MTGYNPLNPLDYYALGYDFWSTTLTQGPRAGLDVLRPHYQEQVGTGLFFVPGAGTLGKAYKVRGGLGGGISLSRTLARPGGTAGFIVQQTGKTAASRSKGVGVMALGRVYSRSIYAETSKLLFDGDYDKAAVQWWGPPGSLLIYERMTAKPGQSSRTTTVQPKVVVSKPKKPGKKPSKMPAAQKKRLWRMGLRWCRKHGRYDKCASRAR